MEHVEALRSVITSAAEKSPRAGKRVTIQCGKHKGKSGTVIWHGLDKFYSSRYEASWMETAMRQAIGTIGYRIKVRFDDGSEAFTKAEYAKLD